MNNKQEDKNDYIDFTEKKGKYYVNKYRKIKG